MAHGPQPSSAEGGNRTLHNFQKITKHSATSTGGWPKCGLKCYFRPLRAAPPQVRGPLPPPPVHYKSRLPGLHRGTRSPAVDRGKTLGGRDLERRVVRCAYLLCGSRWTVCTGRTGPTLFCQRPERNDKKSGGPVHHVSFNRIRPYVLAANSVLLN